MNASLITRLTWLVAALLAGIAIAANFGCLGGLPKALTGPGMDKLLHFVGFGTLAVLLGLVPRRDGRWSSGPDIARRAAVLLAIVTAEELSQILIATRSFSFADLGADVLGIALGAAVAWRIQPRARPGRIRPDTTPSC